MYGNQTEQMGDQPYLLDLDVQFLHFLHSAPIIVRASNESTLSWYMRQDLTRNYQRVRW